MTAPTKAENQGDLGSFATCVEVIHTGATGDNGKAEVHFGSGTLIAGDRVLTCGHLFGDDPDVGTTSVRTISGSEHPARVVLRSTGENGLDLAVLEVDNLSDGLAPAAVSYGRIPRTKPRPVTGCWAVGFPYFQEHLTREPLGRQTAQVWGYILPGTNLREPRRLDLVVTIAPVPAKAVGSPWAGMSGAAVFVTDAQGVDLIIGVVTQHNVRAGASVLTVTPLSELEDSGTWADWHTALGSTFGADMRQDWSSQTAGLPANLLLSPMIEACARAGLDALGEVPARPGRVPAERSSGTRRHTTAAQALLHRSMAMTATPPPSDAGTVRDAERISRSPQVRSFVEQVLGHELLGDLDADLDALLRSAFANLCDTYGALDVTAHRDAAYDGVRAWARFIADALPEPSAVAVVTRSFQLYDAEALQEQLRSLRQFTAEQKAGATVVAEALEHLRQHVREANSRVSLTMLGQNRSLLMGVIYVEPSITLREKPLTARDDAHDDTESTSRPPDAAVPAMTGSASSSDDSASRWRSMAEQVLTSAPTGLGEGSPLQQLSALRSIVLGDPGVGKSTLSRKLAYDGAAANLARQPVPFVVVVRDLASQQEREPLSIVDHMTRVSTTTMQMGAMSGDLMRYFLYSGDLHVIFDGLDEVVDPENYDRITQAITSFCLEFRSAKITITSRAHGFDRARFGDFAVFQLSPFDDARLGQYVRRWFALDTSLSEDERESYSTEFVRQSTAAGELRRIPLLLALMCSIFAVEGDIPSTLSEIYQKCAQLYFRDWDARRKIRTMVKLSALHDSVVFQAFSALAANMLDNEVMARTGATRIELTMILQRFFETGRLLQPGEERQFAEDFAEFISGRAWLVDTIGRNDAGVVLYQFTHRTFMEYFAAEHYARSLHEPRDLAVLALNALTREGQIVVAQLVLQIRGRTHPEEVSRCVELVVSVVSYTPLERRVEAAKFAASLVAAVSLQRDAVQAIVRFCIATAVSLGECYRVSVWTSNGYSAYESTELFEYRSLGQAMGWDVDEPGMILQSTLAARRVSLGVVMDAVRQAFVDLQRHRPDMALFLPRAVTAAAARNLGSWAESSARWGQLFTAATDAEAPRAPTAIAHDPSLAIYAALERCITWTELMEMHGLSILFLEPLNPLHFERVFPAAVAASRIANRLSPADAEVALLEAVANRTAGGLLLPQDAIRRHSEDFYVQKWAPTADVLEPSFKAICGVTALVMARAALEGAARTYRWFKIFREFEPLQPLARFIELYREGATEGQLRAALPAEAGPGGEGLLVLATQLPITDLKLKKATPVTARMPKGALITDTERPYWLSSPVERLDQLEETLELLEKVRTPKSPYEVALANALCEFTEMSGKTARLTAALEELVVTELPPMLRLEIWVLLAEGASGEASRDKALTHVQEAIWEFRSNRADQVLGRNLITYATRIGRLVARLTPQRRFRPNYQLLEDWLDALLEHRLTSVNFTPALDATVEEFRALKRLALAEYVERRRDHGG
ncbi:MAG: NACHT domain-containing protein [Pseudonocardiales bacterium]|nr:NACHT domain-containing protein [Pseudonocardiales bacterium]